MMMAYIMCHVMVENTHFMRMYIEYIYIYIYMYSYILGLLGCPPTRQQREMKLMGILY